MIRAATFFTNKLQQKPQSAQPRNPDKQKPSLIVPLRKKPIILNLTVKIVDILEMR
jgi:hypothetical protein